MTVLLLQASLLLVVPSSLCTAHDLLIIEVTEGPDSLSALLGN